MIYIFQKKCINYFLILLEHQKVHINYKQIKGRIGMRETKMHFREIDDKCPYIAFFVNNELQKQG